MQLLDFIINLSIFSLFVSMPLVIGSFVNFKPLKHYHLVCGIYGGLVSVILVMLAFQEQGYSYDIRYAPVILVFAYFGTVPGIISGVFTLLIRLLVSGQWYPAIFGWIVIMIGFVIFSVYLKRFSPIKKTFILYASFTVVYAMTVLIFNIVSDHLIFHFQYLLFVLLGVIVGGLLIESYVKQYQLNSKLAYMYQKVEASEVNYRLIAENTSDLIMVINKDCTVSYLSPSHVSVLGYQYAELDKMDLKTVCHPDDYRMYMNSIKRMLEDKQPQSIEFRYLHKNGQWIEFESQGMPVRGEDQHIGHIVLISRDISERNKAERILLQSEKLAIVGELAAGIAHEIRNPLTTIKGFVQLNKWENESNGYNDLVLSELERIEMITSELLSLGKPQAIQMNKANLRELLENTLKLLLPQAHMKNIQFKQSIGETDIFITCEKNQLKQVFLNILKNAIEAMPSGGEIHIQLKKDSQGDCLISIQDQGIGIPEELLPRIGEPFYTLKEKGTGLGLMISRNIIKQHQGTITYQSKENKGTLVEIKLPMR